ncbi:hypothetical protein [Paenibacillus vietnamensis]|nr:hypothetical protein [Paenibacillus vietnamensis]
MNRRSTFTCGFAERTTVIRIVAAAHAARGLGMGLQVVWFA